MLQALFCRAQDEAAGSSGTSGTIEDVSIWFSRRALHHQ